jgi:hypothetical protein
MINTNTAIPCVILTVHSNLQDQRVDVQPLINKIFPDGSTVAHPPILNVPLIFPSSKTSAFTFPVDKGDTVLCVFSQRGLDTFKAGGGLPTKPTDFRKHDRRDAMAIPGLSPFSNAINNPKQRTHSHSTKDAVIAHNIGTAAECEVRLKPDGKIVANSPVKVEVNAPDTVINSTTATVNATDVAVNATSTVVTSPTIRMNGTVTVYGNFSVASGYTSNFNGSVTFTGGSISHDGKNIGSTHNHNVVNVQTGSSTVVSAGPN